LHAQKKYNIFTTSLFEFATSYIDYIIIGDIQFNS
jgi:hypothetical protein